MDKILHLDHVDQYNRLYGLETLHPLVSVINLNEATRAVGTIRFNYGVYALFLKLEKACDIKYGRQKYDYEEGTIVCFAPDKQQRRRRQSGIYKPMPMASSSIPTCFAARH